jgi:uncharacterized protein YkwD
LTLALTLALPPARTFAARTLALAFVLIACAACAGGGEVARIQQAPLPPPPDPKTEMAALEQRIFELIQAERHKIDPAAKTLTLDAELVTVAREHSTDMATRNYFAHKGPDGATSASLIMDEDADFQGLLGENLAAQYYVKQSGVNVESFAQRFVKSWLDSPEHRDNLAFAAYDRSGVGAAVNGDTVYVTQLFATDMGLPAHVEQPKKRQVSEWNSARAATAPTPVAPR